ncbi:MAG: ABC transporter permease [Caldilineaceae bacterium]|nr:ABC transporter permease [Caldilineaceae bacterium]MCB9139216.1 ABC transporter permease [Caldilineaceae bacterium]
MRASYLLGKLAWALFTILFVICLNFFLFRVLPGDPVRSGVRDPRLTQEAQQAIRERFGLDKPVINCFESLNPVKSGPCLINPFETQFFLYVRNLLTGDLGISYHTNRPVSTMLGERLWNTILLIGAGQILAIILGMGLGILAAWKARTPIDFGALLFSLLAWSLPTFWLGIILLFAGSRYFNLPLGGMITPGVNFPGAWARVSDMLRHMLLPTLTYTIVFLGEYMLIMRSTLVDVLSEDYILTARAKGLNHFQILKDHALKNAMLPMVTIIALNLGFTVAGAVQIETVFSWPGLGGAIFEAVGRRDYPMLQGAFLLLAVSVIFANLGAELLYSVLDPRIRAE